MATINNINTVNTPTSINSTSLKLVVHNVYFVLQIKCI